MGARAPPPPWLRYWTEQNLINLSGAGQGPRDREKCVTIKELSQQERSKITLLVLQKELYLNT